MKRWPRASAMKSPAAIRVRSSRKAWAHAQISYAVCPNAHDVGLVNMPAFEGASVEVAAVAA